MSRPLKVVLFTAAIFAGGVLCFSLRPRTVWYVEEALAGDWKRILRNNNPPFTRIRTYTQAKGPPQRGTGWLIAEELPAHAEEPVLLICSPNGAPSLADTGEYGDALVLALDPWLVFHKHSHQGLPRSRAEAAGAGSLILPGGEDETLWAWTSQLLQEKPGVFTVEEDVWNRTLEEVPRDSRFQKDAQGADWLDATSLLLGKGQSWLYAPLSRMRELSSYDMGLITGEPFPGRQDWNEYGLQAEILWAIPMTGQGQTEKLAAAKAWLLRPEIQTAIAERLRWIPAHPRGEAYNPISRDAQLAWFSSSFIWQAPRRP